MDLFSFNLFIFLSILLHSTYPPLFPAPHTHIIISVELMVSSSLNWFYFFFTFLFFLAARWTPLKLSSSNSRRWFGAGGGQVRVWWSKLHKHHKNLAIFLKKNCKLGYIPFHRVIHISIVMLVNFHSPHSIKNTFFCDMKLLSPSLWHK